MGSLTEATEAALRFRDLADCYCALVDGSTADRSELLVRIYRLLPELISSAIRLPQVELSEESAARGVPEAMNHEAWERLYHRLQEELGDWDVYRQVFNPVRDTEAIPGSLADDIADVYRDLNKGVALLKRAQSEPEEAIWEWRIGFDSHWGKHAIDMLRAIHFLLEEHGLEY